MNTPMTNGVPTQLVRQWVSVVDTQGRERLEARWLDPQALPAAAHAA